MTKILLLSVLFLVLGTGCATREIYFWGEYENVIYKTYKNPGDMPTERQVEILEADFEKAKSKNQPLPPGWHTHLGLLYYDLGNIEAANREFRTEKANFPESKVLVDFFLKSQKSKKKKI